MKRAMLAAVAALMAAGAFAAQCKGLTQKGERCKREPAEGSEFCIGHADQAKDAKKADAAKPDPKPAPKAEAKEGAAKPAAEKKSGEEKKPAAAEKKAGEAKEAAAKEAAAAESCWAITEAGTRCKRKRVGESDYCRQHAPDVKPSKKYDRCRAITYDGTQCTRKPVEGGRYCQQHGEKKAK